MKSSYFSDLVILLRELKREIILLFRIDCFTLENLNVRSSYFSELAVLLREHKCECIS